MLVLATYILINDKDQLVCVQTFIYVNEGTNLSQWKEVHVATKLSDN